MQKFADALEAEEAAWEHLRQKRSRGEFLTRHLSAAQFVQDQRDAVALVASQDGRFTVFAWSPPQDMVQAYRVEAFLL